MTEFEVNDVVRWFKDDLWFIAMLIEKMDDEVMGQPSWSAILLDTGSYYVSEEYVDQGGLTPPELGSPLLLMETYLSKVDDYKPHDEWGDVAKVDAGAVAAFDQDVADVNSHLDRLVSLYTSFQIRGYPSFNLLAETAISFEDLTKGQLASLCAVAVKRLAEEKFDMPELS